MAKEYNEPMHTAEHVLNQTMVRMFSCGRCFSSHLNSGKSKCDYHFSRPLTDDEALKLEEAVNTVLHQNLEVQERMIPYAEAKHLANLGKLPADVAARVADDESLPVRLVFIGDYDICPCIGAHVQNTQESGTFHLLSHSFTPAADASQPGVLRLRFKISRPG